MAAFQGNCPNNFSTLKMDTADNTGVCLEPSNASPPDFDFNLPCGFFKSSFARSLSLNNTNGQCKSLDYDIRSNSNNSNNNRLQFVKRQTKVVPPMPQRRNSQAGSCYTKPANEANKSETVIVEAEGKPPALPARRPPSLHNLTLGQNLSLTSNNSGECQMNLEQQKPQPYQQQQYAKNDEILLTALHTNNSNNNHNNNSINQNNINHVTGLQAQKNIHHQQHQHQLQCLNVSNGDCCNKNNNNSNSIINGCSSICNGNNNQNNNNSVNNFRRNNIVWPHQQENVEQNCNLFDANHNNENVGNGVDLNSNYSDTTKLAAITDYNNHLNNSQQATMNKIPTINVHINQQQQEQQQQQQQQLSSYNEILNDNNTNVEAVILQNQVDTLQWQLKQMETSCDMYRAVMEEVARFLERYQAQKQLQEQQQQQQQQQEQQQQQQTVKTHKLNNSNKNNNINNQMEQIPRSKSLFQVYVAGGHDKSLTDRNNSLDERTSLLSSAASSSMSYLRARSSTNLMDLKPKQNVAKTTNTCNKKLIGHSKDDHNYETELMAPNQSSYSTFKDFTWRRYPKKADSRLNLTKETEEEKLNLEGFRLLRTIQNLLNTSQHQPELPHQRHSLTPSTAMHMGRLAKAISTTSVTTMPSAQQHINSTSLNKGTNSAGCSTPDLVTASPSLATTNADSNNLAPEMLFLRTANIRDSRLSLRSSTDSSVHSTSSAASSASSKLETDEEAATPFQTPSNVLHHKQPHHLTGSSTEDESGFSSISSFADIGVPLSSTLLSNTSTISNDSRIENKELKSFSSTNDSRNSTLKANTVGLPLNSLPDMSHRWDSPSKTYHNAASNKFQRFSALSNEDSNAVLWV